MYTITFSFTSGRLIRFAISEEDLEVAKELVVNAGDTAATDLETMPIAWRFTGQWMQEHVARKHNGRLHSGLIIEWAPGTTEDAAMWHMAHDDGDEEDLNEAEVTAAMALYAREFGPGKRKTAAAGTSRSGRKTTSIDFLAAQNKRPRK